MREVNDRVAVVTGAAGGIGRAMVARFLDAGMKVVLAGANEERLTLVLKSFSDSGARVLGVPTDVSEANQVADLAARTLSEFGGVHVLCNNAGVAYGGRSSWETPPEAWQWVINVNLMGVVHGIHTFIPIMLEQDTEAHVVNTASNSGLVMNTHAVPYGVSKHAVVALSESLHLELLARHSRVNVSVLCPGPVSTGFIDSSRRNLPGDVPAPVALTPEESLFRKAFEIYLERGLEPRIVAGQVLDAIRTERFYVIPHDYNDSIETRMKNILNAKNPEPVQPSKVFSGIVEELVKSGLKTPSRA